MRARSRFGVVLLVAGLAPALPACTTSHADVRAPAVAIPPTSGDGAGTSDEGKPFDNDASAVVGHAAPAWRVDTWINSPPVTLESLRGRVVFVRWFMGSSCPMCSATAPSLNALHDEYDARGLSVIGMYTHKDDVPLTRELVSGYVAHYGFHFPVAIDDGWRTLRQYWLGGHEYRKFTSVSFLIDKKGIVRHVHLGGRLAPTDAAFSAIETYIQTLLAEPS
jgi:peroxiredoxin